MADMEIVEVARGDFRRMTREDARAFRRDQKAKAQADGEQPEAESEGEPESTDAPAAPETATLVTSEKAAMGKPAGKSRAK